jgi:hypothetical protein
MVKPLVKDGPALPRANKRLSPNMFPGCGMFAVLSSSLPDGKSFAVAASIEVEAKHAHAKAIGKRRQFGKAAEQGRRGDDGLKADVLKLIAGYTRTKALVASRWFTFDVRFREHARCVAVFHQAPLAPAHRWR